MATITQIKKDYIKAHKVTKKIVNKLLKEGFKDGQFVYKKTWNPKNEWHFVREKLSFYHPLFGLEPCLIDSIGATGRFSVNKYVIKKTKNSSEIRI